MRKLHSFITAALLCLTLAAAGCVTGGASSNAPVLEPYRPTPTMGGGLYTDEQIAVAALDMARQGVAPQGTTVTMAPDGVINLLPAPNNCTQKHVGVTGTSQLNDGLYAVEVAREFEGDFGCRTTILDMALYTLYKPDNSALPAMAEEIMADYKAVMQTGTQTMKAEMTATVRSFQEGAGLKADGVLGPNTATAMAATMNIQEFQALMSTTLYAEQPRFEIYLLEESVAKSAPQTYLNGFASLEAVRARAIPPSQYKEAARKGGQYLTIVYFMDRVAPGTPIQIAYSPYDNRKDIDRKATARAVYSDGTTWPVVVTPVTFKNVTGKLYAHVIASGTIIGSTQLK